MDRAKVWQKPGYTRCEIYAGPDKHGAYHYALFWWADYHPGHPLGEYRRAERGQHFLGRPPDGVPQVDKRGGRGVSQCQ